MSNELETKLEEIKRQKDTYIIPENIKKDVNIYGVTGSYTSDATAIDSDILINKTAYVNGQKIIGTYDANVKYWGDSIGLSNQQLNWIKPYVEQYRDNYDSFLVYVYAWDQQKVAKINFFNYQESGRLYYYRFQAGQMVGQVGNICFENGNYSNLVGYHVNINIQNGSYLDKGSGLTAEGGDGFQIQPNDFRFYSNRPIYKSSQYNEFIIENTYNRSLR